MPGLWLTSSNRMERLVDELAAELRRPLARPLAPEVVVVPNGGVARWLSLQLAARLGVWANFRFLYPDLFLAEAGAALLPGAPNSAPFQRDALVWRLMRHLGAKAEAPGFAEVRRYLGPEGDGGVKRLELARELATLFELYQVFRPDLLVRWDAGADEGWQPELWRAASAEHPGAHLGARLLALLAFPDDFAPPPGALPERVTVFGLATLAPARLDALASLARWTEVRLFAVNPSRVFWGELVSDRRAARLAVRPGAASEDLYLERGHALLAASGRLGREFFDHAAGLPGAVDVDAFEEPGEDSLLHCLQSDVLHLVDRGAPGSARRRLAPGDESVQVHSCHSPLREVEVLQDQLLELFRTLPGLTPGDVLVATPDVATYAPLVEAIWGGATDPLRRLPFSLADRGVRAESALAETFRRLLAVAGSRLPLSAVLDLLQCAPVARRFALAPGELDLARHWLGATRVRWGMDGAHRAGLGLPAFEENSWRAAFRRLLLGYALPGGDRELFGGVLPWDGVEGSDAAVLGRLVEFGERLFALAADLARPRPLGEWAEALGAALTGFLDPGDDGEAELQALRRTLGELAALGAMSGFTEPLGLRAVASHLAEALDARDSGAGFLGGRITVSGLRPLRSVPFRVVCLLGLNDRGFPRADRRPGFDLMARHRRPGDPSARDEDRYLFLETVLSARDRLYLSYVGQSLADNSALQPSVVLSELLDAVAEGFEHPAGALPGALVTCHRLQAFSAPYFDGSGPLFSYSADDLAGALARRAEPAPAAPWVTAPLPPPGEDWRTVDIDRLASFFANPAKHFCTRRLGVWLDGAPEGNCDREPAALKDLDRYGVQGELLDRALDGEAVTGERALLGARGVLPPGCPGDVAFEEVWGEVAALQGRLAPYTGAPAREPLAIDLALGPFRVTGRLPGLRPTGLLRVRPAAVKAKDLLRAWVHHLVLQLAAPPGAPLETLVVGKDRVWRLAPVDSAKELLTTLLHLYWRGCSEPLRLFPACSQAYAERLAKDPADRAGALAESAKRWATSRHATGDQDDPYFDRCFGAVDSLGGDFEALTQELWGPLLGAREQP